MGLNTITKRWVRGSLLITIIVLLLAEGIFLWGIISNHYDAAYNSISTRMETLLAQLSTSSTQSAENRGVVLRRMVEHFTDKDLFELTLLNQRGYIVVSSTGYVSDSQQAPPEDYILALESNGTGDAIFTSETGEKVMAITMLLPDDVGEFSAVRMMTSLTLIDDNISTYMLISFAIMGVIILFSVWSGMFFISGIVHPINEIERTADKISKGDFDIRIDTQYKTTEIKNLVVTINNMAQELEKTERMKNDFISSVSHELRTPLTSIKGWVETLHGSAQEQDPMYNRGLKVIYSETDRLYDMVEELLDFSRMQNGIVLNSEVLDLVAEVTDSVLTVEQRVNNSGMSISYDEPEMPIAVFADASRLRQVFINIFDNAIKYSQKGDIITVEILCDKKEVRVKISDMGQGITPEDLEHVKLKFYKGRKSVRGNGIGLAVVDEIANAHGGKIEIESEYTKGTQVTLHLPLYDKNNKGNLSNDN